MSVCLLTACVAKCASEGVEDSFYPVFFIICLGHFTIVQRWRADLGDQGCACNAAPASNAFSRQGAVITNQHHLHLEPLSLGVLCCQTKLQLVPYISRPRVQLLHISASGASDVSASRALGV